MEGTVKWFNRDKGFGFIEGDDKEDYFVHHTALDGNALINENDRVSFEAATTERGKQARDVKKLGASAEPSSDESDSSDDEESAEEEEEEN